MSPGFMGWSPTSILLLDPGCGRGRMGKFRASVDTGTTMRSTVSSIWTRIEKVLWEVVPETARTLAPPATDKQIEDLEASIGLSVPEAFKGIAADS